MSFASSPDKKLAFMGAPKGANAEEDQNSERYREAATQAPRPSPSSPSANPGQDVLTQPPQAAAAAEVPGLSIVDGLMDIALAPGRAIVSAIKPQGLTPRDLPIVILISAGVWWAGWWAFNKYVWKSPEGASVLKKRFKKKAETVEIGDEEEDDE